MGIKTSESLKGNPIGNNDTRRLNNLKGNIATKKISKELKGRAQKSFKPNKF